MAKNVKIVESALPITAHFEGGLVGVFSFESLKKNLFSKEEFFMKSCVPNKSGSGCEFLTEKIVDVKVGLDQFSRMDFSALKKGTLAEKFARIGNETDAYMVEMIVTKENNKQQIVDMMNAEKSAEADSIDYISDDKKSGYYVAKIGDAFAYTCSPEDGFQESLAKAQQVAHFNFDSPSQNNYDFYLDENFVLCLKQKLEKEILKRKKDFENKQLFTADFEKKNDMNAEFEKQKKALLDKLEKHIEKMKSLASSQKAVQAPLAVKNLNEEFFREKQNERKFNIEEREKNVRRQREIDKKFEEFRKTPIPTFDFNRVPPTNAEVRQTVKDVTQEKASQQVEQAELGEDEELNRILKESQELIDGFGDRLNKSLEESDKVRESVFDEKIKTRASNESTEEMIEKLKKELGLDD